MSDLCDEGYMSAPLTPLEQLLANPRQGPESHPEMFRLLREATLVFLMPYHPEIMGTYSLKGGDSGPKIVVWKSSEGPSVPVFTSIERANEACKKLGVPDKKYALAEMKGQQLFSILRAQQYPIMLNPSCGPATTYLDQNAIKMLADGSILKPIPEGAEKRGNVVIVDPADYPTDFLQPLFQFLRQRTDVKAAWLFKQTDLPAGNDPVYVFVLKALGDAKQLKQDFGVVAKGACPKNAEFGVVTLDPNNAALVQITSKATPFYSAPDYQAPGPV